MKNFLLLITVLSILTFFGAASYALTKSILGVVIVVSFVLWFVCGNIKT